MEPRLPWCCAVRRGGSGAASALRLRQARNRRPRGSLYDSGQGTSVSLESGNPLKPSPQGWSHRPTRGAGVGDSLGSPNSKGGPDAPFWSSVTRYQCPVVPGSRGDARHQGGPRHKWRGVFSSLPPIRWLWVVDCDESHTRNPTRPLGLSGWKAASGIGQAPWGPETCPSPGECTKMG